MMTFSLIQHWTSRVTLLVVLMMMVMLELKPTGGRVSGHERLIPSITQKRFKAAVFEYRHIAPRNSKTQAVNRKSALELMQKNLEVFSVQANEAALKGADILVFPEDGIYGYSFTRETIKPYLEFIPDPDVISWSPCDDPKRFPDTEVQRHLSCLAKNNSIYIVADMGDIQTCKATKQPNRKCPSDGVLQYNTAVAYDPSGTLVAKYHKRNLFYEFQFDHPESQIKYFDTPFGRFGLFICFDILFQSPAVDMVTEHGITNVIFPTAWMDAPPLLTAIGWHSSFAMAYRVNLLVANLHDPSKRFQGSGIYTPYGEAGYYYDNRPDSNSSLVIAEIDVLPTRPPPAAAAADDDDDDSDLTTASSSADVSDRHTFENNGYTFYSLKENGSRKRVCQKRICCTLDYVSLRNPESELIVLGAFDGLLFGEYALRVCVVYKCPQNNQSTCGDSTYTSSATFLRALLRMSQDGSSPVGDLFPQVIESRPQGQLGLAKAKNMDMDTERSSLLWLGSKSPLITMAIVGRDHDRDDLDTVIPPDYSTNATNATTENPTDVGSKYATPDHALLFVVVFQALTMLLRD